MFLPPGADNPSYAVASAQQCKYCSFSLLYREQERALQTSAASDGGPGVSHTQRVGVGRRSPPPFALHVCVLTGAPRRAPETWPLPAVLHAHPPVSSTDCPSASNGGRRHSPARRPGGHRPLHFPGRAVPVASSLGSFATFRARPTRYVDQSIGSPHQPGTASRTGR